MGPLGIKPPRMRVALIAVLAALAAMAIVSPGVASAAPSMSVRCDPGFVDPGGQTNCLARIDTGAPGTPVGGKVVFNKTSGPAVNLGSGSCEVQHSGSIGFCSLPASGLVEGKVNLLAIYSGPGGLASTTASFTIDTKASIVCHPEEPVVHDLTECRVNIPKTSGDPNHPTGIVEWSTSGPAESPDGDIDPTCLLQPEAEHSSCSVTFTPSAIGTNVLRARFVGDGNHPSRGVSKNVTVTSTHETKTLVACEDKSPASYSRIKCTATTTNVSPGGGAPVGSIDFESTGEPENPAPGMFPDSASCVLKPMFNDPKSASCTVRYEPGFIREQTVLATYGGAPHFERSGGGTLLIIQPSKETSTSLVCSTAKFGEVGKCIVTVADISEDPYQPAGLVNFSASGVTEFSPKSCQLLTEVAPEAVRCEVTYRPFSVGVLTLHAEYPGDPNWHRYSVAQTHVVVKGVLGL